MKTVDRLRNDWILATEINKLEARLWRLAKREHLQTVLITSAVRGEGKSTTVAYLATSLGLFPGRKILALDFDFRVPSLNNHFGLTIDCGIDQVLKGERKLDDALIRTGLPSLHLAPPTPGGADPNLLLRTQELMSMVGTFRDTYDLVLIDTPALIPVPDTTMLMPLADGLVISVMAGKTTEPQLRRTQEICRGMDTNILGLVVSNLQEAAPEYLADDYDYYEYATEAESRGNGQTKSKG